MLAVIYSSLGESQRGIDDYFVVLLVPLVLTIPREAVSDSRNCRFRSGSEHILLDCILNILGFLLHRRIKAHLRSPDSLSSPDQALARLLHPRLPPRRHRPPLQHPQPLPPPRLLARNLVLEYLQAVPPIPYLPDPIYLFDSTTLP